LKSTVILLLKIAVSVGSFLVIFRSIAWADVIHVLKHAQYSLMLLALAVFATAQIFSALRCVYVARVLGGPLSLRTSLRAHFVGLWFNQVLPTGLGGDVVKIAILRKSLGLSIAIRSAVLDRISGLIFLLVATTVALPIYGVVFRSHPEVIASVGVIGVGGSATIFLAAWIAHNLSRRTSISPALLRSIRVFSDVWSFKSGRPLLEQICTSAIVHFNGIATYAFLGYALGVHASILAFVLVVPVVFLITLIPVSFAGWGIREVGAVLMFNLVGVGKEVALAMSVSFGLLLIVAGLPGLFIWMLKAPDS